MTQLLHRYKPFTIAALTALAKQDIADRRFAAYTADMMWLIARRLTRGRFDLQTPSRFAFEAEERARGKKDMRTGKQIVDDLIKQLRKKESGK